MILCTEKGIIKKTPLESYSRPRLNGINAISINEGDCLLDVQLTNGTNDIVLALKSGRAVRFNETKVRSMGRNAAGVRGVTLANDEDKVIGMVCVKDENIDLLVVSEKGYGKKSSIEEYRITNRGGKGVKTLNITEKTGYLVGIHGVTDIDDLMIINRSGITIRLRVADLRVIGRATQGVRLIKINEGDEISSVAKIENEEKAEEIVQEMVEEIVLNQSELPADESLNPDLTDPDLINEN